MSNKITYNKTRVGVEFFCNDKFLFVIFRKKRRSNIRGIVHAKADFCRFKVQDDDARECIKKAINKATELGRVTDKFRASKDLILYLEGTAKDSEPLVVINKSITPKKTKRVAKKVARTVHPMWQ